MTPCPICTTPFKPEVRGGHAKRFCSVGCKRIHEKRARVVGEAALSAAASLPVSRATDKRASESE